MKYIYPFWNDVPLCIFIGVVLLGMYVIIKFIHQK